MSDDQPRLATIFNLLNGDDIYTRARPLVCAFKVCGDLAQFRSFMRGDGGFGGCLCALKGLAWAASPSFNLDDHVGLLIWIKGDEVGFARREVDVGVDDPKPS